MGTCAGASVGLPSWQAVGSWSHVQPEFYFHRCRLDVRWGHNPDWFWWTAGSVVSSIVGVSVAAADLAASRGTAHVPVGRRDRIPAVGQRISDQFASGAVAGRYSDRDCHWIPYPRLAPWAMAASPREKSLTRFG